MKNGKKMIRLLDKKAVFAQQQRLEQSKTAQNGCTQLICRKLAEPVGRIAFPQLRGIQYPFGRFLYLTCLCLQIGLGCFMPFMCAARTNLPFMSTGNTEGTAGLNRPEAKAVFRVNQFGYISDQSKKVIFVMPVPGAARQKEVGLSPAPDSFFVYRVTTESAEHGVLTNQAELAMARSFNLKPVSVDEWFKDRVFYVLDLKEITRPGKYQIKLVKDREVYTSPVFKVITRADYVRTGVGALLHYFRRQRASTPTEWAADAHLKLKGSARRVDLRGGWCDASGDVSKYFSHLAYTDYMSPQQIPLATWSLIQATEKMQKELKSWNMLDSIRSESLWGADYLMRSLSDSGYFYMTVFSYFKKDPSYREIVGLEANSVTTTDYACALREGGGMAIAALARISTWKQNGAFHSSDYLKAATRAYRHLLSYNTRYDDDGVANIIDDYCGLMAATELWHATNLPFYQKEARRWAAHLCVRYQPGGYLRADGSVVGGRIVKLRGPLARPFWHASDAGLPVLSLMRYLDLEKNNGYRVKTEKVLRALLSGQLALNRAVANPFDYPRQMFLFKGKLQSGFFIPHENESGWWWQGENARLASLATAALVGRHLLTNRAQDNNDLKGLSTAATDYLSWITGCNPYGICFLYGFGEKNVPYMHSNYGHGSETGGISNGITGLEADGTGIAFKTEDQGNEWRWTEQWLPHAAWYLQALTALETEK